MKTQAKRSFIYRDYWDVDETHRPYQNMLHSEEDKYQFQLSGFESLFFEAGVKDGDEIEVVVRRTGRRPFGNRIWKLVKPHTYRPVEKP